MRSWLLLIIALGLLLAGCASTAPGTTPSNATGANGAGATNAGANVNVSTSTSTQNQSEVKPMATKNPIVIFETTKGTFKAEIFVDKAPITGNNFMKLVRSGFYNGLKFHRVEPNFVIQGGDPKGDGTGGSGTNIALEIVPGLKHELGTLAMARANDPNSASSQFYVVTGPASFLDGQYAVFGRVTGPDQMVVVNKIVVGDKMTKVYEQN
jgi:cyclophilin family peptidyl-prolyl cis-trans isomerase